MTPLFRPEALAARQTQWLGSVRLSQPIGYSLTASVGLAVAVGIGLFAAFGTYTKKATVPGLLAPGSGALRLTAATAGTLVDLRVSEGARVAAGDVLFVISGERVSELGETQALIAREHEVDAHPWVVNCEGIEHLPDAGQQAVLADLEGRVDITVSNVEPEDLVTLPLPAEALRGNS